MPSTLAHYAVAAAVLAAVGLRGRTLAVGSLWAIVPDLDIVTAAPWLLAAPELPLDADALVTGAYVFGHRGLSHTFLAAVLAAGVAWAWTSRRRWAAYAGLAWTSHVLLDAVSPWPTTPYWPVSTAELHAPLVTGLDPLMTLLSVAAIVALAGPWVADRWSRVPGAPDTWQRIRARWGHRLAVASLAAVAVNAAWLGAVAATSDATFEQTYSANLPRTVTVVPDDDAWRVDTYWLPGLDTGSERIPEVRFQGPAPGARAAVETARCTLDGLGPYSPVSDPVWLVRRGRGGTVVEAVDLVRNATGTGSPRLLFTFLEDRLTVTMTGEEGRGSWFELRVPQAVVEAARCR